MSLPKGETVPDAHLQNQEKNLIKLCSRLSKILDDIGESPCPNDRIRSVTKERIANSLLAHDSFMPLRIWMVTIWHKRSIGRYKSDQQKWCARKVLNETERVRGTYFTLEDARDRARVLKEEATEAGKVMDEDHDHEDFQWAMVNDIENHQSDCNTKGMGVVFTTRHQLSCYIQRYDVDGPGRIIRDDDDDEKAWGSDSEVDGSYV